MDPRFLVLVHCGVLQIYFSGSFPLEDLASTVICVSPTSRELSSWCDLAALEIDTLTCRLSIFSTVLLYPLHAKK